MIDVMAHIERTLVKSLADATAGDCPAGLAAAVEHAVFPGGERIRPQLCLAVAGACGSDQPRLAMAAAVAIELLHCASLVQDDLPCSDNAPLRRGQPSVHAVFGERLAILAGDALLGLALQTLVECATDSPRRSAELMRIISNGAGLPSAILADQAREFEPRSGLRDLRRTGTSALITASAMAGAAAAGKPHASWRDLGERLEEAYRIATVRHHDAGANRQKMKRLVDAAVERIPACPMAAELRLLIILESRQYLPLESARRVA